MFLETKFFSLALLTNLLFRVSEFFLTAGRSKFKDLLTSLLIVLFNFLVVEEAPCWLNRNRWLLTFGDGLKTLTLSLGLYFVILEVYFKNLASFINLEL